MCGFQDLGSITWNVSKQFEMQFKQFEPRQGSCKSLTVTDTGEIVIWVEKQTSSRGFVTDVEHEAHWYDQKGKLIHTFRHDSFGGPDILALQVDGDEKIALSSSLDHYIWLWSSNKNEWSVGWKVPFGSTMRPMLSKMCPGKPGQIIALDKRNRNSVIVFDVTQIPFDDKKEIELEMKVNHMCYLDLPGVGGALAVTICDEEYKLGMVSLESGKLIWSIGGYGCKVAGAEWKPQGVSSDNRGRLYVADEYNDRIIVLSASSGTVLQIIQGRGHMDRDGKKWVADAITVYGPDIQYEDDYPKQGVVSGTMLQEFKHRQMRDPKFVCWNELTKSITVGSGDHVILMKNKMYDEGKQCILI